MKKIFFILLIFSTVVLSQTYQVNLRTGYYTFNMKDIKKFQSNLISELVEQGLHITTTDNFFSFFGYGTEFELIKNNYNKWGFRFDFTSTGGRTFYKDYSGLIKNDILLKSFSFGTDYSILINQHGSIEVYLKGSLFYQRVELTIKNETQIAEISGKDEIGFHSNQFIVEPAISIQKPISNIVIGVELGYALSIPTKLFHDKYKDAYLMDKGEEIFSNWSGMRSSLIIGYRF